MPQHFPSIGICICERLLPREIDTVSDRFVESLLIFGDKQKIREHLIHLLGTEMDEVSVSILIVSDPAQEGTCLAKIIGTL